MSRRDAREAPLRKRRLRRDGAGLSGRNDGTLQARRARGGDGASPPGPARRRTRAAGAASGRGPKRAPLRLLAHGEVDLALVDADADVSPASVLSPVEREQVERAEVEVLSARAVAQMTVSAASLER